MTDSNRSASEVPALLEERRKYEGWLAALEARRESTPQHVFDRVRSDYDSRMRQVEQRLAAHRQSIQDERASLQSRLSLLEAEEQLRRDERAELELRAHVGELSGGESDEAFRAVDEALAGMSTEKGTLTHRIAELDALLELKSPAAEPADTTPEQASEAPVQAPASETDDAPASALDSSEPPRDPLHTPGGSFDELAFLTDVVGLKDGHDGEPTVVRDEPSSESILDGIRPVGKDPEDERTPLASNAGNTPIVLRTSSSIEQSKTLKCTECGAMNYPTEWYCERCGAELAAL